MNDSPRLLVYGVSVEAWTRRYGVEPFTHPCYVCGRPLTTSIPFAQGSLRGLQAPACACGDTQTPYEFVRDPACGDLFTGIERAPVPRRRRFQRKGTPS